MDTQVLIGPSDFWSVIIGGHNYRKKSLTMFGDAPNVKDTKSTLIRHAHPSILYILDQKHFLLKLLHWTSSRNFPFPRDTTLFSQLPIMTAPRWHYSFCATKKSMLKKPQLSMLSMSSLHTDSCLKSLAIETPVLHPNSHAKCAKYWGLIKTSPLLTTREQTDSLNEQINGWNNTFGSGPMKGKTIGRHTFH